MTELAYFSSRVLRQCYKNYLLNCTFAVTIMDEHIDTWLNDRVKGMGATVYLLLPLLWSSV